ncbi:MAG: phosphoribosylanthranilate isomerase [Candidatus Ornithomonoglobus sp.]
MTKIKICGLTNASDARIINDLRVDYAGVVMFFPKSKRNMSPEKAREIISAIDTAKTVAVVVSPTVEQIKIIEECGFDIIQIHGETPNEVFTSAKLPIFKAFNVKDIDTIGKYEKMDNITGYVFDAAQPGSGKTFDWSMLKDIPHGGKLLILAGGLRPDNVAEAIGYVHPDVVDVSSGVENDSGVGKSRDKAESFINVVFANKGV